MHPLARPLGLFVATLLVACSAKKDDAPAPAAAGDAGTQPAWTMPDVAGVDAMEDTNPDPNVVEVSLTASKTKAAFKDGAPTDSSSRSSTRPLRV